MSASAPFPASPETLIDLDQALVLCTRLCHDLAGPIGALATGAELLEEDGTLADGETLALLSDSAQAASARLKILRMATGVAKGRQPALREALEALSTMLGLTGRRLDNRLPPGSDPGAPTVRLLLNVILVAADAWPQSPLLTLDARPEGFHVEAQGGGPLAQAWTDALAGEAPEPRTALAWLAGRLASQTGARLHPGEPPAGGLDLTLGATALP